MITFKSRQELLVAAEQQPRRGVPPARRVPFDVRCSSNQRFMAPCSGCRWTIRIIGNSGVGLV